MVQNKTLDCCKVAAMSPDLNPTEHLWTDLKTAAGRRHSTNLREMEQLSKEEWTKLQQRGAGI
ncbi:hypothetical protein LDENG_00219900 [Lucifuga dentata]|nr:hypothetical protein LDENG_00219900 [Lucifuga dentata]